MTPSPTPNLATKRISFFVPGIPKPGGSKKGFGRNGHVNIVDDCKKNADWRYSVAAEGAAAHRGPLLDCPLEVTFQFIFRRPIGHYRTGSNSGILKDSAPSFPDRKPDVLKLSRSTEDALTGIIWTDDARTVRMYVSKRYGDKPGCRVTIEVVNHSPAPSEKANAEDAEVLEERA